MEFRFRDELGAGAGSVWVWRSTESSIPDSVKPPKPSAGSRSATRSTSAELYWLTTVRKDGRPHITPLVGAWVDDAFVFCTGPEEQKAQNLDHSTVGGRHDGRQHVERRARRGRRGRRRTGDRPSKR